MNVNLSGASQNQIIECEFLFFRFVLPSIKLSSYRLYEKNGCFIFLISTQFLGVFGIGFNISSFKSPV